MVIDARARSDGSPVESTICVVGGGVAGIVLALELAEAFEGVVLLESGDEEYDYHTQQLYAADVPPSEYPDPMNSRLRFLGGTSNHWQNNTSPLSSLDFAVREWIPHSGWPISLDDLTPYYARAGDYCGVGHDGYATNAWCQRLDAQDRCQASDVLETRISKFANPPVRFFERYGPRLIASRATVYKNANVVDLDYDAAQERVRSVSVQTSAGNKFEVHADTFILCLGGIENARMLLCFNARYDNRLGNQGDCVGRYFMGHPTPRAAHLFPRDRSALELYERLHEAGDRLVTGFFTLTEGALTTHRVTNLRMPLVPASRYQLSDGISSYHLLAEAIADGDAPAQFGQHLSNILRDIDLVLAAAGRQSFGFEIPEGAREFEGYSMPMMMEQLPRASNRITLGSSTDWLGLPRVRIDWHLGREDREMVWAALEVAAREFGALGIGHLKLLRERGPRLWYDQLGFSSHHMGTTRMAKSAREGVVDPHQRVFGTDNLFVAGSSVFPTGGHVPPTLTIVALALRLVDYLKHGTTA